MSQEGRDMDGHPEEGPAEEGHNAEEMRYQALRATIPDEIDATLQLIDLTNTSLNPLIKLVQRAGPRGTETVDACKEWLVSVKMCCGPGRNQTGLSQKLDDLSSWKLITRGRQT